MNTAILEIFTECVNAIRANTLINRVSKSDKEFHFQNWFEGRLRAINIHFDKPGRNTYPDFPLVSFTEGYEIKGLAWPGREADYDCNSQVPSGYHNGRTIFYVFGRYPSSNTKEDEYPVVDLAIVHGDFLNADHNYVHKNRNVKGFGSYGDIMIRDRKMYVAPTPFALVNGLTGTRTLILPENFKVNKNFINVGNVTRIETNQLITGYNFNLTNNEITPQTINNSKSGTEHNFIAYRLNGDPSSKVNLKNKIIQIEDDDEN